MQNSASADFFLVYKKTYVTVSVFAPHSRMRSSPPPLLARVHAHCSSDTHIGLPHHHNPLIDPIDGYQGRDHAVITWRWFLTVRFGE
jgi:hypothetical protein